MAIISKSRLHWPTITRTKSLPSSRLYFCLLARLTLLSCHILVIWMLTPSQFTALAAIVVEGKDILPPKHSSASTAFYVTAEFGSQKRKTKTVKNSLEPNWGETFDLYVWRKRASNFLRLRCVTPASLWPGEREQKFGGKRGPPPIACHAVKGTPLPYILITNGTDKMFSFEWGSYDWFCGFGDLGLWLASFAKPGGWAIYVYALLFF